MTNLSFLISQMVLSACSPYFEDLFLSFASSSATSNANSSNLHYQFVVCLKDTAFEDALLLVEFMYKGEVNVPQDRIHSLLKVCTGMCQKSCPPV